MNNLTTQLLVNNYHYEIEEFTKQGQALTFDSGKEQRAVTSSIPAIELTISYRGLTFSEYEAIRKAYEDNHSNTFICDLSDNYNQDIGEYVLEDYIANQDDYIQQIYNVSLIDKRPEIMGTNSAVWAFKSFEFNINAKDRLFSGKIQLVTSVFFNYSAYQDLFSQSSSYTDSQSVNQDFINVLDDAQPYQVGLKYSNNALFSNIGQSVRHAKNKGGLKRAWTLNWLLEESDFLKLLTFYRKKSGIMGEFGMPSFGTNQVANLTRYVLDGYLENQNDYVALDADFEGLNLGRFAQDSFQYQKRVDGLFVCRAEIIEVKQ